MKIGKRIVGKTLTAVLLVATAIWINMAGVQAAEEATAPPTASPSVEVPAKVSGITMKTGTSSSMQIAWDAVEGADGYEIYTSEQQDGKYVFLTQTKETQYTFKKMIQGRLLYVKIRAVKEGVEGTESDVKAIAAKPDAVSVPEKTAEASQTIRIRWNKAAGATGYCVYYKKTTKKKYTYAGETQATNYQVEGLTAGTDYDLMVRAYAADATNESDDSAALTCGTAPAVPVISELKGGDKRLKVYWKKSKGAETYRIYFSEKADGGFQEVAAVDAAAVRLFPVDKLSQNKTYYVKIAASRVREEETLTAESVVLFAATKKAGATSTKAKNYTTLAKFKKSNACKQYKVFKNQVLYNKCYVLPGMKKTNTGGFISKKMVPQSIAFAGDYLLISAYDKEEEQESVIYIVDKKTRKYMTSLILPHRGHVGGMAYDGNNLWISYGKNVQCIKYEVIADAVKSSKAYTEIYSFTTQIAMTDTASYMTWYKDRLWVGTYNQTQKKYMYAYEVENKTGVPALRQTNKMKMPNRTQGVTFDNDGNMLVSRSCQTKAGKSGFLCRIDVYAPTWKMTALSIKKNSLKKTLSMPPMNEGIAVCGAYTYLIFESPAFSECEAPVDRVAAFKTKKIVKIKKK